MDLGDDVEEDVCRVCRLEADEENPMVHPCRCSGSVRWVHPDCLKSWLAMSQKKHCEICGHRYTFTKVYPETLPTVIPPEVYGRQAVVYLQRVIGYAARCVLVVMVWLVILPNMILSVLTSGEMLMSLASRMVGPPSDLPGWRPTEQWSFKYKNPFTFQPVRSLFRGIRWSATTTSKAVRYTLAGPTSFTETCQDMWAWMGDEWNDWVSGEKDLFSSPLHIFRAQVLSLLLIGVILALIFIREWYSTFTWPTGKPKPVEMIVDPDEWLVVDGVPRRVFERVPATRAVSKFRFAPKWLTTAPINEDAGGLRIRTDVGERRFRRALAVLATIHGYDVLPGGIVKAVAPALAGEEGRISDPALLPVSRTPSSDRLRRRSEGDTRGVLVRFPSAPHLNPDEAPALARSNSSPSNQSPTDTTSQAIQVQMAQAHAKGLGKAKAKPNGAQPLGKLQPPRLTRTYSELQKSPVSRDEQGEGQGGSGTGDEAVFGASGLGDDVDKQAEAGPGPTTIAMAMNELAAFAASDAESPAESLPIETQQEAATSAVPKVETEPPASPLTATPRPLFSQPAHMPYGSSPTQLARSDTEKRRAPDLLLGMSKGKGKARAAEPEVAKESGQLVRAQSTSAGSPTSRARFPAGSASVGSSSGVGLEAGMGDDDSVGEAGWVKRRRMSSTASRGTASSLGKAAAAALREDEEREGTPSPTPMSAGLRRSARLGSQEREKLSDRESSARDGAGAPQARTGQGDEAMPLKRSPIPAEWVRSDEGPQAGVAQVAPGRLDAPATSEPRPDSTLAPNTTGAYNSAQSAELATEEGGQKAADVDIGQPVAETHLLDVPILSGNTDADHAEDKLSPIDNGAALRERGSSDGSSAGKTPVRSSRDDIPTRDELWEQLDKIDGAAVIETPPAGPGAAPGAPANANAGPHVMRAQLGGFGVEIQLEQRPPNQRPAIDRVDALAALDVDGLEDQMGAVHNHAAGEAEWEDIPDDEHWDDEEEGGWVGEDWDQIFELLGFEGDLSALFQNLLLAMAVMTAVLFCFVLVPIGVSRAFLAADAAALVWDSFYGIAKVGEIIWKLSVEAVRPLVVLTVSVIQNVAGSVLRPLSRVAEMVGLAAVQNAMMAKVQQIDSVRSFQSTISRVAHNVGRDANAQNDGMDRTSQVYNLITSGQLFVYAVDYLDTFNNPKFKAVLDACAKLGRWTQGSYQTVRFGGLTIARSYSLPNSVICLLLGYVLLAWFVILARIIRLGGPTNEAMFGRWCMFIKLSCFILIELVVFPLTIGAYINIAAMPIFPNMSFRSRFDDLRGDGAFGTVFVLWMIGTMFMYGFAQVISWIRSICRVGSLYFIRDPHDPNYSAVKDMIERPTYSQLHKMSASTIMYGTVVGMLFGSTTWTLHYTTNILPLKLKGFGPLSSIPFDYLFLLIVVPPTIDSIRPRHTLKWLLMQYWRFSTKIFRLRALLIGRRYTLQRHSTHTGRFEHIVWALLDIPHQWFFGKYDPTETLMRVPAADSVVLLTANGKRQPMFIPLNEDKTPKTREAKIRMLRQDVLARRATPKRDPIKDYTIVRVPRYWRTRVHMFIFATLAASAVFVAVLVVLPILVGRKITSAWVGDVHDGYSYIAGSYAMYIGTLFGYRLRAFIRRAFTHAPHYYLTNPALGARTKRTVFRTYAAIFSLVTLFLVHPLARGLVWEMRLGMLVRHGLVEGRNVLHLWDMWSIGAVLNVLESGVCALFPDSRAHAERDHRMHALQFDPLGSKIYDICRYALTAIAFLLGKSASSYLVTSAIVSAFKVESPQTQTIIFRLSGLLVWAITETIEKREMLGHYLMHVRQDMIDAEYVLEERVENYVEPPVEVKKKGKKGDKKRRGLLPGGGAGAVHAGEEDGDLLADEVADAVAAEVEQVVARGGDLGDPELAQRLGQDLLPRLLDRAMQRVGTESDSEDESGEDGDDESEDEVSDGEEWETDVDEPDAGPVEERRNLDVAVRVDRADPEVVHVEGEDADDMWKDEE